MFAIVLFAFGVATIGYGTLMQRVLYGEARDLAYSATLGVAALIVLGGVLNTLGLAYGLAIDGVLFAGVVIAFVLAVQIVRSPECSLRPVAVFLHILREPGTWLVAIAFAFTSYYFAPTVGYNPHDDLVQYLMRPYDMMSFGTVGANSFDSTGADSLGAQSWLLAFLLRYLPLEYANALDPVICFTLCGAMLLSVGRRLGVSIWLVPIAILAFVMLNPSQVNVSAVYSLSLMICGLAMALLRAFEAYLSNNGGGRYWFISLLPAGVFLAALVALKFTTLLFVGVFGLAFSGAAIFWLRTWRDVLIAVLSVAVPGALTLGLWAAPFTGTYMLALAAAPPDSVEQPCRNFVSCWLLMFGPTHGSNLLSLTETQYGQIGLVLTVVLVHTILVTTFSLMKSFKYNYCKNISVTILLFCLALIISCSLSSGLVPWGYIRYAAPIANILFPLMFLFSIAMIDGRCRPTLSLAGNLRSKAVAVLPVLIVLVLVFPSFAARVEAAVRQHISSWLFQNTKMAANLTLQLGSDRKAQISALQARIPADKKILAVMITPSHLDRRRNSINALFLAALSSPWWDNVDRASPSELGDILRSRGIDYLIWQRSGDWIIPLDQVRAGSDHYLRVIGRQFRNYLAFDRAFRSGKLGPIVYRNAEFTVFQLRAGYEGSTSEYAYPLGTSVDFTAGADYAPYIGTGWSFRETSGMWSDGPAATLRFDLDRRPEQLLTLEAQFSAFVAAQHPTVKIDVEVNGRAVASWRAAGSVSTFCATIPPGDVPERTVAITFRIDGPPSPAELGVNSDRRNLGILLKQARLSAGDDPQRPCGSDSGGL